MAKNGVQFQKGLSLSVFMDLYGTEELCREAVYKMRWPHGFRCPECGGEQYCEIKGRKLLQCNQCHRQTSLTAGTIFQSTKLQLKIWFLAMYFITQGKDGISSIALSRHLGVSHNTAWSLKHKLMQVMLEREGKKQLSGRIEVDDAYWGGERSGGKRGRGAPAKTPFLAAVETTMDGEPVQMKLNKVDGFRKRTVLRWSQSQIAADSFVLSDGLRCFNGLAEAGCIHLAINTEPGKKGVQHPAFQWVNTMLGNIKTSMAGTYHSLNGKHLPRYLASFQYRFNRRFDLAAMMPRLLYVAVRTPPMPGRLLKLAEVHW